MRRIIILLLIVIGAGLYLVMETDFLQPKELKEQFEALDLPEIKSEHAKKPMVPLLEGDLFDMVGKNNKEIIDSFGEPDRKDLTPYGFIWWVYTDGMETYIQFGMKDDRVVTVFATGKDISSDPFAIGTDYEEIEAVFPFEKKVTYKDGMSLYNFLLKEDDLRAQPLIKLADDLFVQCYFDTFTDTLSSIRIATGEVLLSQRFYEMEYRGSLPEEPSLGQDDWKKIEHGMTAQVFDLTNVYRHRFNMQPLVKDEKVAEVAWLHSKDMSDHHYFSHYRPDGSGLKERLEEKDIYYLSAGENIASQHTDGPAAMEGWLNSEGHREALLHEDYTHLGVGVYRLYYTQNFLLKP